MEGEEHPGGEESEPGMEGRGSVVSRKRTPESGPGARGAPASLPPLPLQPEVSPGYGEFLPAVTMCPASSF